MTTATTSSSLSAIGQIAVPVADLQRAIEFYRDQLGQPFLFEVPGMAFFDCGGVRLLLNGPEAREGGAAKPDSSVLYFRVENIHAAHDRLEAQGVTIRSKPHLVAPMPDHDLWMAFFDDSEGNLQALMAELPKRAD